MKKFVTLFLLTLLSLVVSAADQVEIDGIYYSLNPSPDMKTASVSYNGDFGGYSGVIVIPESLTIWEKTFSVTSIRDNAFKDCSGLTSVTIPNSVISIGYSAFEGCSGLTSVTIPNSVTSIGGHAFKDCSGLTSVTIPNNVFSIGDHAFYQCSGLESVVIGRGVTGIGGHFFSGCSGLTSITIPNNVTSIGERAFGGCSGLTSVTIPNSVAFIEYEAFYDCSGLESVTSLATNPPQATDNSFSNYDIPLYVPKGAHDAYRAASPWNKFKEILSDEGTKYTLTYMVDGEEYKTYQIAEGSAITPEPAPTKDGYVFSGWTKIPATMPAEDVTITGSFSLLTDEDEITIKDIGKTTWCSEYDLDFTNVEGIKAYTATGYNNITKTIWLTRVMEVPAGTGILVKGDAGTYKIPHAEVQSAYANWFVGNLGETISISETDGDKTNYYLSGKDGSFVSVNGSANIGKNKAYLQLPTSIFAGTRSIGINYDDEDGTTSIKEVKSGEVKSEKWYTLQGQRVAKPGKGLYIHNGKKVIVR